MERERERKGEDRNGKGKREKTDAKEALKCGIFDKMLKSRDEVESIGGSLMRSS